MTAAEGGVSQVWYGSGRGAVPLEAMRTFQAAGRSRRATAMHLITSKGRAAVRAETERANR
jgi:hypothetical protein